MLINSDNNSLLILKDQKLIIRNLNEYTLLKYQEFNGNRIILKIGNTEIIETYNDGIFNVCYNDLSMQIRDPIELCKRIKFNDQKYIIELLINEKSNEFNMDFIVKSLSNYFDNLKFTDTEIIINSMFSVDLNGQAYYFFNDKKIKICIVASNLKTFDYKTQLGNIKIDFRTLEIIHKVLFLLFPNCKDLIFFRQLPKKIQDLIL
jgi:hypothetical protein